MSQQIYKFVKFLEQKEGRTPPSLSIVRYGTDEEKNDEEIQMAAVEEDWEAIIYIVNPTELVQLASVEKYGCLIKDIIHKGIEPSEAVQLAAVKNNGGCIYHIIEGGIEPSEDVQLAAVENEGSAIIYIDNPKPKVRNAAYLALMQKFGNIPNDLRNYFN